MKPYNSKNIELSTLVKLDQTDICDDNLISMSLGKRNKTRIVLFFFQ